MKKILIAIVVIIILIFAYGQYKEHQRFHPKNANLKVSKTIDVNYYNKETLYNYYEALEAANNYMQMQWSANKIDVRSPEDDNEETNIVITEYGKKIAKLNFYKTKLEQSFKLKKEGLINEDIALFETKGITVDAYKKERVNENYKQMLLEAMPQKPLFFGQKSPFIFELQKLLVKKGYELPVDGIYKTITSDAIKAFEEKKQLFPDGKIDVMTLKVLLK